MNYVDLIIFILIIFGALLGFKRGFTRELVDAVGLILCLVFAFILKNPLSVLMYEHLPFFTFGGIIKGVIVLNILVYEVIAFLVIFAFLKIVWSLLKSVTSIFEKILKATIILGIPSMILGAIIGAIKWLLISYVVLFALSLPIFNNNYISESKICNKVLNSTPIISGLTNKTLKIYDEFSSLKTKYEEYTDTNAFNLEALDMFLKYDIIDIKSADKLYQEGKFSTIKGIETVLDKYR